jgi:Spy/CpxP family protein refolding chaperone
MNTSNTSTHRMRPLFKRLAALALVVGVAVTAGVTAIAHTAGGGGWHHGRAMTAADMDAHVDEMLQHIYSEIDVTDAQKAQIDPLVKQAVAECAPLHEKFRAAHVDLLALFGADRVDRDAIERVRSENMRLADEATQRVARLVGDVADVLTPEQRKALVARITQMHAEVHE